MADTFTTLWRRLQLHSPGVGALLAQDLVRDAVHQFVERRDWSWNRSRSEFYPAVYYNTGTAGTTNGSTTITGSGTAWGFTHVNMQIRVGGLNYPIFTIIQVLSTTSLVIDRPWPGASLSTQQYEIHQCYFPVPADFHHFDTLTDPSNQRRLHHNCSQRELDRYDPQRTNSGQVFAAAFLDFTQNFQGVVKPVLQVRGTGPSPVSTTSSGFSYPADSIYTVEITTGGIVGTAIFKWKQDGGAYTSGVVTDSSALDLSNGVQVYFPAGTYVSGDTFIIRALALAITGQARYELWPHPKNTRVVFHYQYIKSVPDISDAAPVLPPFLINRGDVLLEMSLANACRFKGTESSSNPAYDLQAAVQHDARAERRLLELERRDDEVALRDLEYERGPFELLDGSWLQKHAVYPYA